MCLVWSSSALTLALLATQATPTQNQASSEVSEEARERRRTDGDGARPVGGGSADTGGAPHRGGMGTYMDEDERERAALRARKESERWTVRSSREPP